MRFLLFIIFITITISTNITQGFIFGPKYSFYKTLNAYESITFSINDDLNIKLEDSYGNKLEVKFDKKLKIIIFGGGFDIIINYNGKKMKVHENTETIFCLIDIKDRVYIYTNGKLLGRYFMVPPINMHTDKLIREINDPIIKFTTKYIPVSQNIILILGLMIIILMTFIIFIRGLNK